MAHKLMASFRYDTWMSNLVSPRVLLLLVACSNIFIYSCWKERPVLIWARPLDEEKRATYTICLQFFLGYEPLVFLKVEQSSFCVGVGTVDTSLEHLILKLDLSVMKC